VGNHLLAARGSCRLRLGAGRAALRYYPRQSRARALMHQLTKPIILVSVVACNEPSIIFHMLQLVDAIILGLTQGLTEFIQCLPLGTMLVGHSCIFNIGSPVRHCPNKSGIAIGVVFCSLRAILRSSIHVFILGPWAPSPAGGSAASGTSTPVLGGDLRLQGAADTFFRRTPGGFPT